MAVTPMPTDPTTLVYRCAWCGCNRDRGGNWTPAPQPPAPVSHGMCPACFKAQMASLPPWPDRRAA